MPKNESLLFLKALKEDGIEHVHIEKKTAGPKPGFEFSPGDRIHPDGHSKPNLAVKNPASGSETLGPADDEAKKLRDKISKCKLCSELAKTRNKTVFGAGSLQAKLVFVGEAPGADEDEQGLPFVGRAGQLLTKIIEAMGMTRDQVFICNVLKCRPPNNRPPAPGEVVHCRPYLKRQLEIIKPKVIVALGNHAVRTLLQTEKGISELRGTFQTYEGIPMMCTYHPAYLLRSPGEKRKVWEDMKKVSQFLERSEE